MSKINDLQFAKKMQTGLEGLKHFRKGLVPTGNTCHYHINLLVCSPR